MSNGTNPLSLPFLQNHFFVICPACGNGTGLGFEIVDNFFRGNPLVCETCGASTDAWRAYVATLNHSNPFLHDVAAVLVGYKSAVFKIELGVGKTIELRLSEHGVPPGSRIIRRNYSPRGLHIFPVELHGNEALVQRGRDTLLLYGRPLASVSPDIVDPATVTVQVWVTFAEPNGMNEQAEEALGRAFVALSQNEFIDMVIPAAMAVEFTCKRLTHDAEGALGLSTEGVKDKDLLTEVIPTISAAAGLPMLDADICAKVGRLWGQRDRVAHTGQLHEPYVRENAATQLAAAVFAFRYLKLLRASAVSNGIFPSPI